MRDYLMKKNKLSQLQQEYELRQKEEKAKIKQESKRFKRFLLWCKYLITFPFKWLWVNIRDWRTALVFVGVFLVLSSEVWVPYLIGLITWGTDLSKWMFGVASACWLFWLGPGTPFMVICISLTIAVKGLFNKIKGRKHGRKQIQETSNT